MSDAKAAAWAAYTAAAKHWVYVAKQDDPVEMRRLADAACEYAGKRVERHVAVDREACASLVERCGIVDDIELRKIANLIRERGAVGREPHMGAAPETTAAPEKISQITGAAPPLVSAPQAPTEAKASVPPFECGRAEGRADVKVMFRKIIDPSDDKHLDLDGVIAETAAVVRQADEWQAGSQLADQLCEVLGREVGKTGESEGAVQVAERIIRERDALHASLEATVPRGSTWSPLEQAARLVGQRDGLRAALVELDGLVVFSNQKRIITEALEKHGGAS